MVQYKPTKPRDIGYQPTSELVEFSRPKPSDTQKLRDMFRQSRIHLKCFMTRIPILMKESLTGDLRQG